MKLLAKKQVNEEVALQKSSQIKEGVTIARKIDVLRETLASLEKQREIFLAGSKEELKRHTADLQKEADRIKGEIRQLEERRKELLKPLDDKWAKLEEAKEEHEKNEIALNVEKDQIQRERDEIEKARITLIDKENIVADKEYESKKLLTKASEDRERAGRILEDQIQAKEKFEKEWFDKNREQDQREAALVNQANINQYRENILNNREKELNDKETFINDKYETLLRTIKRLK